MVRERAQIGRLSGEIIAAGRRLWQRGLVAGRDGNISARVGDGLFLITASGVSKGFLQEEDILLVDSAGRPVDKTLRRPPSIESSLHLELLRQHPETNCVLHAHPPYATAFTLSGLDINAVDSDELKLNFGYLPTAAYYPAGSPELAREVAAVMRECSAALLARHGAVVRAASIEQALLQMEALEQAAQIAALTRQLVK